MTDKASAIRPDMVRELRALAEKATPGPWDERGDYVRAASGAIVCDIYQGGVADKQIEANAAYIAAVSPDVVLAFIERMAALEGCIKDLSEWLQILIDEGIVNENGHPPHIKSSLLRARTTLQEHAEDGERQGDEG